MGIDSHDDRHRQDHAHCPEAGALHEIVDGVWAWVQPDGSWWLNNAGAIGGVGDDGTYPAGTVIVDTCATFDRTRAFLDAVAAATGGAPITMAANTHQHGDHTYGNSVLPSETVIIGHEAMRAGLLADPLIDGCPPVWAPVPQWGPITRRVPQVAVRDSVTVFNGSRRVDLRHPGYPAHTTGDLVAWLPDERVLFTGDLLFHGLTPLVFMGAVGGARRSLDWLASFTPDHAVPGHGPLIDGTSFDRVLAEHDRYYRFVEQVAADGRREGLGPLEAARACELGEFAGWSDAERLVLNLHRAYADAEGGDLDLFAAIGDAVAYNGGPMTTHVCCVPA
jgi:cyclase